LSKIIVFFNEKSRKDSLKTTKIEAKMGNKVYDIDKKQRINYDVFIR